MSIAEWYNNSNHRKIPFKNIIKNTPALFPNTPPFLAIYCKIYAESHPLFRIGLTLDSVFTPFHSGPCTDNVNNYYKYKYILSI